MEIFIGILGFVAGTAVGWVLRNWTLKSKSGKRVKKEIDARVRK